MIISSDAKKKHPHDTVKVDPKIIEEEQVITSLRVTSWNDFIGQENIKQGLAIALSAAKQRKESIEHVLLYGPPGLGKTSLALLIAKEMGVRIRITSGPAIERSGDLAAILSNLEANDILFIDEVHRLNKVVEETLYPAMEDYALDIVVGKGPSAHTVRLDLPPFTIIGATTRVGLLSSPLRDRFGIIERFSFYHPHELELIIKNAAVKLKISVSGDCLHEIALRARGTPRIALKLLKRIRDIAQVSGISKIEKSLIAKAFSMLKVDELGLDTADRRLILSIIEKHQGGPVGVETIAATISEDVGTIEEVLEPYLLQIGFIRRTNRGRIVTAAAFTHFGKKIPHHVSELSNS